MRVVDTSVWIEWLTDSDLGRMLGSKLPDRASWIVPTMVQLELAKVLTRTVGEAGADAALAFTRTCQVVDLDTLIALAAAEACRAHQLSTADAVIYATALASDADLLTCDRHFSGLPSVEYIAKS